MELKNKLTPMQYYVTQECGTEPPFNNEFWNNKEPGIYVDIISGEPLFSSTDKYDSKTGWPSFTKPLVEKNIVYQDDYELIYKRTEVKSKEGKAHLGHVFDDGPAPDGKRYCINSSALKFIPLAKMKEQGYGKYLYLFNQDGKTSDKNYELAIFAGGCFWGVQNILSALNGVIETKAGYTGGNTDNPTYDEVRTEKTGHAEAVLIKFDPDIISYETLLDYFWRMHDPTTKDRQGYDKGTQYRSAIFYHSEKQKQAAEKSKQAFDKSGVFKNKAVTEIVPASKFYEAEDYHQNYYFKKGGESCHVLRDR